MKERKETPEWEKFSKMFNWVARSKLLSAFEKLLYTRLNGHLGQNSKAWPGMKALAYELGSFPSQVAKGLKKLEQLKLISVIRRRGTGRKMLSNEYTFLEHAMMYEIPVKTDDCEDPLFTQESTPIHPAEYPYSPGRCSPIHLVGAEETHSKRSTEETHGRDSEQTRGSLRSPQSVSLRSSEHTLDLTERRLPHHESGSLEWTGATALASSPYILADVVAEADLGDDMNAAERIAAMARVALMAADKADVQKALNAAKKKAKEKAKAQEPEVARDGLPALKRPKQTLFGIMHSMQNTWVGAFKKKFPNDPVNEQWGPKQVAQLKGPLQRYSEEDVERAIRYFITYWDLLKPRFPKMKMLIPTLGAFCALDETLVPEAKRMFGALKAKMDYDQWCNANPSATSAPDALQAAYDAVREELKLLGI